MHVQSEPIAFPFAAVPGLELDRAYAAALGAPGLVKIKLPYGEPAWLATRYDDVKLVLGDRRFSRAMAVERDAPRVTPVKQGREVILSMDPPKHTRLRTLVAKAFTKRRVERLRPRIRELADGFVTEMIGMGPPVDLVEHFALPIPVAVICELIGVPVADRPKFRVWSDTAMSTAGRSPEEMERNRNELHAYLWDLIACHRAEPADDLMTALIEARDAGDRLSEQELLSMCVVLLVAGHETTASQIPNFVYTLLRHPSRWAELQKDPDLIPAAVEELMRFVPLIDGALSAHYATEDVRVGGTLVRAGEPIMAAVSAANHDGRQFPEPDEIRFDRPENQHMGFGHRVHHCLGAQLARVELQEAMRVLLDRLPGLHVAGEIVWKELMFVRGPRLMPVGW